MVEKIFTNCFLIRNNNKGKPEEICLAWKKRGFGANMWNGSGGKPKEGESIEEAARREVEEELMVKVSNLDKRGEILFILRKEDTHITMYVFAATIWEGIPKETEEMRPEWFLITEIPYEQMWEADREWLPYIFEGKKIRSAYTYAEEGGKAESGEIIEVKSF